MLNVEKRKKMKIYQMNNEHYLTILWLGYKHMKMNVGDTNLSHIKLLIHHGIFFNLFIKSAK
jgi:hypothetical protein